MNWFFKDIYESFWTKIQCMKEELNKMIYQTISSFKAMFLVLFNFIFTNYIYALSNKLMFVESVIYCCQGKRKVGWLFLKEKYSEFASLQNYPHCRIKTLFCSNGSIMPTFKFLLIHHMQKKIFSILTAKCLYKQYQEVEVNVNVTTLFILLVTEYKYVLKGMANIFMHLRC